MDENSVRLEHLIVSYLKRLSLALLLECATILLAKNIYLNGKSGYFCSTRQACIYCNVDRWTFGTPMH